MAVIGLNGHPTGAAPLGELPEHISGFRSGGGSRIADSLEQDLASGIGRQVHREPTHVAEVYTVHHLESQYSAVTGRVRCGVGRDIGGVFARTPPGTAE